jgi:hypothetical protein
VQLAGQGLQSRPSLALVPANHQEQRCKRRNAVKTELLDEQQGQRLRGIILITYLYLIAAYTKLPIHKRE